MGKSANSGVLKPYAMLMAISVDQSFIEIVITLRIVDLTPISDIMHKGRKSFNTLSRSSRNLPLKLSL